MKKKILFFINALYGGGAEKVLQDVLSNLDYNLFDVTVYSLNKTVVSHEYPEYIHYRYIFDQLTTQDSQWKQISIKVVNKIKLLIYHHLSPKLFYWLFVRGKYDTEIAFIEGYATRIVSGSCNKASKKIAWVHIDLKQLHWTDVAYKNCGEEQQVYRRFDEIIAVSHSVKDSFSQLFPHPCISVCYNPINDRKIRMQAGSLVTQIDRDEKKTAIVTVGRLVLQKGYDRLLAVAKKLKEEGFVFSLTIIGEGEQRQTLEQYIRQNDLQEEIRLIGFQINPYPYIINSDLFVCSSRVEGYSTAVTEALILGVPVIATDCAGMNELLGSGEYGMLVENSEEALLVGLRKMLSDSSCRKHNKIKAAERGNQFSLPVLMKAITDKF